MDDGAGDLPLDRVEGFVEKGSRTDRRDQLFADGAPNQLPEAPGVFEGREPLVTADGFGFLLAPRTGEGSPRALDGGRTQHADLTEPNQHGRGRDAVGVLEADDLVVGDAMTTSSDFLGQMVPRDEEGTREAVLMTDGKGRIGSSFEDYLAAQGTLEETNAMAVKRVLAWQLEQAMERRQMSKSAMADAMRTSRSQLDRILDPDNDHIRLDTLAAAAKAVGLSLKIELVG